jgi:hypothetical protein
MTISDEPPTFEPPEAEEYYMPDPYDFMYGFDRERALSEAEQVVKLLRLRKVDGTYAIAALMYAAAREIYRQNVADPKFALPTNALMQAGEWAGMLNASLFELFQGPPTES